MKDQRPFKPLYEFRTQYGATAVIHEGDPVPYHWQEYFSDSSSLAKEVLRLKALIPKESK